MIGRLPFFLRKSHASARRIVDGALDEKIQLVGEIGVVGTARERREPKSRLQPERFDIVGGRLHSGRIIAGIRARKILSFADFRRPALPGAVDLEVLEPERAEIVDERLSQLFNRVLVAGAAMFFRVPRAVPDERVGSRND